MSNRRLNEEKTVIVWATQRNCNAIDELWVEVRSLNYFGSDKSWQQHLCSCSMIATYAKICKYHPAPRPAQRLQFAIPKYWCFAHCVQRYRISKLEMWCLRSGMLLTSKSDKLVVSVKANTNLKNKVFTDAQTYKRKNKIEQKHE